MTISRTRGVFESPRHSGILHINYFDYRATRRLIPFQKIGDVLRTMALQSPECASGEQAARRFKKIGVLPR